MLSLNKLAASIVSLQTRLHRLNTNFHPFLQGILRSSHVVDNATDDTYLLPPIVMPKEVHLRQLVT